MRGILLAEFKHEKLVLSVAFTPNAEKLITLCIDSSIKLWNLEAQPAINFHDHTFELTTAVFSPDGTKILTASADNTAKIIDLNGTSPKTLTLHKNEVSSAAFSPDGTQILTASTLGVLCGKIRIAAI
ncbi:MAG: hypothetical protein GY757_41000 [bacterium]|nr:hypothetical protein [bacterium]